MSSTSYPSTVHDWMQAIRRPVPYRVGSARLHIKTRSVAYGVLFMAAILTLVVYILPTQYIQRNCPDIYPVSHEHTYPFTAPVKNESGIHYKIAVVTDLDTDSKSKNDKDTWLSYLLYGTLSISTDQKHVTVNLDSEAKTLKSTWSQGGRGMELSELIVFNGKLYTMDDRTGVVYEISDNMVIPWVILTDGNGRSQKGFKSEWATVRNGKLYVGGLGKEWTTQTGEVVNLNPQWVMSISATGQITHHDWHTYYNAMRKATGHSLPGYMIHESSAWSDIHKRWFFLPRRASRERYDDKIDERKATNMMIIANDKFDDIEIRYIGVKNDLRGFSSFKFIPGTNDQMIVALKSEEVEGRVASYILVFTVNGDIILSDKKIGDHKYEGIEFI
ncbi:soluble calcium-activated nucleotidase 1-like [Mizuhopecten yessoensis]|uniref:Soluble calcium-activated nucleotidase 1 n=1 Tax=Mizuhopecten yessoensis TaxID=6573 RepID=A0A210QQB9_MIZYE|nr:soluble calcium-activated nucleotidase 1-like [Mizuhopecten yessoensis]OWF50904.1 Soluble calcium-activated nucleotidase 1 [Mizuhopecten yessoensis]